MKNSDAAVVEGSHNKHIKSALPVIYGSTVTISTPRDYMSSYYQGVYPEFLKAQGREIVTGMFINAADLKEGRKVIVMAERNVNQLFNSSEDAIG